MKRFLVFAAFFAASFAFADKDFVIPYTQIPTEAQNFISENFGSKTVSYAKLYTDLTDRRYRVFFSDGDTAKFDLNGTWNEIVCANSVIPDTCIPEKITSVISTVFPGSQVVEIQLMKPKKIKTKTKDKKAKSSNKIETELTKVVLSNNIELKFDSAYNLIDMD